MVGFVGGCRGLDPLESGGIGGLVISYDIDHPCRKRGCFRVDVGGGNWG